jgi:uncharacterized SAM-binding protein YcdF (DUF218 family)
MMDGCICVRASVFVPEMVASKEWIAKMAGINWKNSKKISPLTCVVLSCLLVFGTLGLLTLAGGVLITADPLEKADAVVLLSGGDQARMDETVRIYEEEFASTIILTETGEDVEGYDVQYSKEQRNLLVDKGVPLGAIRITEKPVGSTRGEAKAVKKLIASDDDVHSIIVVTDSYHSFRTRLQFREVFSDTDIKVLVRPVRDSWYRSTTWWLSPQGWQATILEYFKLAAFIFETGINK